MRLQTILITLFAITASACAGLLLQPTSTEPHATLVVHHNVSDVAGDNYRARILVGDGVYSTRTYDQAEIQDNPVRVRLPLSEATYTIGGAGIQSATAPETTTEERTMEYACYREECTTETPSHEGEAGSVTLAPIRVCRQVRDTCTRTIRVPRLTGGSTGGVDDECTADITLAPDVRHTYYVEFEYRGEGQCSATCYEHVEREDGSYERTPCPTAY